MTALVTGALAHPSNAAPVGRPKPGPKPTIVATEAFSPWAAALEQCDASGDLHWVLGPDGVLLPSRQPAAKANRAHGTRVLNRLAALVGRRRD